MAHPAIHQCEMKIIYTEIYNYKITWYSQAKTSSTDTNTHKLTMSQLHRNCHGVSSFNFLLTESGSGKHKVVRPLPRISAKGILAKWQPLWFCLRRKQLKNISDGDESIRIDTKSTNILKFSMTFLERWWIIFKVVSSLIIHENILMVGYVRKPPKVKHIHFDKYLPK